MKAYGLEKSDLQYTAVQVKLLQNTFITSFILKKN